MHELSPILEAKHSSERILDSDLKEIPISINLKFQVELKEIELAKN